MKSHLFTFTTARQCASSVLVALRLVFPVSPSLKKRSPAVLIAVALAFAGWSPLPALAAVLTILNPTPEAGDLFGRSVATVAGNVLIGASNDDTTGSDRGAAYLYDGTTGALLETYFSPVANSRNFGRQVTSFSGGPFADDILVAGRDLSSSFGLDDRVFQLDATTGSLQNTYTPLHRAEHLDSFGSAVATQGNQILIGSRYVIQNGVNSVGAAYLYDAGTGSLLHTFRPPTKIDHHVFGGSVAFAGDKIVIGTAAFTCSGVSCSEEIFVYDRSDNSLSYTIQDPSPDVDGKFIHFFGSTLTTDGNHLLVGSKSDDTVGTRAGAAYLFDVNTGDLLQSFFNPAPYNPPRSSDHFGGAVALQGNNVLVGASGDDNAQGARSGAAYLFDATTGDLRNTYLRPTAEDVKGSGGFASSVGFVGDSVIIGDSIDNTGAQAAGVVHLFPQAVSSPPHPPLPFNGQLLVTSSGTDNVLQYDGATGAFVNVFAQLGGIDSPQAMTFGPDGNLFVASLNSTLNSDFAPSITEYDGTTGGFLGTFASGTNLPDTFKDMVFGPDGNLYVGCFCYVQELKAGQHQVKRYDGSTGAFIDTFASGGGLDSPEGILFGPDSNLYVSSANTDQVLRYDGATGDFIDVFASGGGLDSPQVLAFGPDNNLYVTSALTDNVLRYDGVTGAFMDVFAAGGGLDMPRGMAFGPDNDLYVSSQSTNQVLRYDGTTGAFIDVFASGGGLSDPSYLLFRPIAVPEPSTLMLSAAAAVCLLGYGWRRRKRKRAGLLGRFGRPAIE